MESTGCFRRFRDLLHSIRRGVANCCNFYFCYKRNHEDTRRSTTDIGDADTLDIEGGDRSLIHIGSQGERIVNGTYRIPATINDDSILSLQSHLAPFNRLKLGQVESLNNEQSITTNKEEYAYGLNEETERQLSSKFAKLRINSPIIKRH